MYFCTYIQQYCKKISKQEEKIYTNYNESNSRRLVLTRKKPQKGTRESLEVEERNNNTKKNNLKVQKSVKPSAPIKSSSSSKDLPSPASYWEQKERKLRSASIFGNNNCHLKKSQSFDPNVRTSNTEDPVRDQWANKGATVYSGYIDNPKQPKQTKYYVHSELQYVIVLPTDKPKKQLLPENVTPDKEDESFSSYDSDDSFIPRSQAKPPKKPKGKFCCAKRQDSESDSLN